MYFEWGGLCHNNFTFVYRMQTSVGHKLFVCYNKHYHLKTYQNKKQQRLLTLH